MEQTASPTEMILVVEDEPAIAESIAYSLRRAGFTVELRSDLEGACQASASADLILLDLMLPDGSGFELIQQMRATAVSTPIIVLSSRDSEEDRVSALERGADDYVTKPFSPREVVARVKAVLRRAPAGEERPPEALLRVDAEQRRARFGSVELALTRVEFDLLHELLDAHGKVFARPELINRVWGEGFAITGRTIDSHIKSLRRKVAEAGGDPLLIETVRGVGYRIAHHEED